MRAGEAILFTTFVDQGGDMSIGSVTDPRSRIVVRAGGKFEVVGDVAGVTQPASAAVANRPNPAAIHGQIA